MFRQNDRSQGLVVIDGTRSNGVTNGTIGTVESIVGSDDVVRLHDGRAATFNSMGYRAFHHAYAITAHKSPGPTVDRSFHLGRASFRARGVQFGSIMVGAVTLK